MKKPFLCSLVLLIAVTSCRTVYINPEAAVPRLLISEGGGFTGAITTYQVLPSGQVYTRTNERDYFYETSAMSSRQAKKFIRKASKAVGEESLHEPDNIYRSITIVKEDTSYTALWYRNKPELDTLYNQIYRSIWKANEVRN